MITREQAGAAALARTIRPAWDQLATLNAIAEVARHDLADVAHAVIRCAQDQTMKTPAAIGFLEGPHWRPTLRIGETVEQIEQRTTDALSYATAAGNCPHCDEHGRQTTGFLCPHDGLSTEQRAEQVRERASAARAAIRPPRLPNIGAEQ